MKLPKILALFIFFLVSVLIFTSAYAYDWQESFSCTKAGTCGGMECIRAVQCFGAFTCTKTCPERDHATVQASGCIKSGCTCGGFCGGAGACSNRVCSYTCEAGWNNLDGNNTNGCETNDCVCGDICIYSAPYDITTENTLYCVNTSLSAKGESYIINYTQDNIANNTILDCHGNILSAGEDDDGIKIFFGHNITIQNCVIRDTNYAIDFRGSSNWPYEPKECYNITLFNNTIINTTKGLGFLQVNNMRILSNRFYNNTRAIYLWGQNTNFAIYNNFFNTSNNMRPNYMDIGNTLGKIYFKNNHLTVPESIPIAAYALTFGVTAGSAWVRGDFTIENTTIENYRNAVYTGYYQEYPFITASYINETYLTDISNKSITVNELQGGGGEPFARYFYKNVYNLDIFRNISWNWCYGKDKIFYYINDTPTSEMGIDTMCNHTGITQTDIMLTRKINVSWNKSYIDFTDKTYEPFFPAYYYIHYLYPSMNYSIWNNSQFLMNLTTMANGSLPMFLYNHTSKEQFIEVSNIITTTTTSTTPTLTTIITRPLEDDRVLLFDRLVVGEIYNPVSEWKFENNTNDGYASNHCDMYNFTDDYVAGHDGYALKFNSSRYQHLSCNNDSSLNFDEGEFSIEFWIKKNDTSDFYLISKTDADDVGFIIYGDYRLDSYIYDGTNEITGKPTSNFTDDNFHHVVFVKTRTYTYFYIDGVLDSTSYLADPDPVESINNIGNLTIGKYGYGTPFYFNGTLDEIRIYPYALSEYDIVRRYENSSFSQDLKDLIKLYACDLIDYYECFMSFKQIEDTNARLSYCITENESNLLDNIQLFI